jgi:hypothetical protein
VSASDSKQQEAYVVRFLSLLASLLKLAGSSSLQGPFEGLRFFFDASRVCVMMLTACMARLGPASNAASTGNAPASGSNVSDSSSGSSSSPSKTTQQQRDAARYVACLPALVLLGRCYLHAGSILTVLCEQAGAAAGNEPGTVLLWLGALRGLLRGFAPQFEALTGAQQLAAAGYTLQGVQDVFGVLLDALDGMQLARLLADADAATWAVVAEVAVQLRAFGVAASAVPVRGFCNNPACVTARGQSRGRAGVEAQQHLQWVPRCALLQPRLPARRVEAAQARVQGAGGSGCWWWKLILCVRARVGSVHYESAVRGRGWNVGRGW